MASGTEIGLAPTPESIKLGTVKLTAHPNYAATVAYLKSVGFDIKFITDFELTRVVSKKIVNAKGEFLRSEKYIQIPENARFLDLEHEVGHVKQLQENLSGVVQYTAKFLERENGVQKELDGNKVNDSDVLTINQNKVTEYHNRLVEFIRLSERVNDPLTTEQKNLLGDHAKQVSKWADDYKKEVNNIRDPNNKTKKFANENFPDIPELTVKVFQIIKNLGL
jgi:hypothetical protein